MASKGKMRKTEKALWPSAEGYILPQLFKRNAEIFGESVIFRKKRLGVWNEVLWKESYAKVESICLGLLNLGLEHGDSVAFIGDTDPDMYWSFYASLCAGAIGFGIWVDSLPQEISYYINFPQAKFIFARDQEQVDKVLKIKEEIPSVKRVVWWIPHGMNTPEYENEPWLINLEDVEKL